MKNLSIIGKTMDAGFQIGARKTIRVAFEEAWAYIFSPEGMEIWLGKVPGGHLEKGLQFDLEDGTWVQVKVWKPLSHVRMNWQPKNWDNVSRLQLRVYAADPEKTVIAFHQEMLQDSEQRDEMKAHWQAVIARLEEALAS